MLELMSMIVSGRRSVKLHTASNATVRLYLSTLRFFYRNSVGDAERADEF